MEIENDFDEELHDRIIDDPRLVPYLRTLLNEDLANDLEYLMWAIMAPTEDLIKLAIDYQAGKTT